MGLLTEKGVTLGTGKSGAGLLQQQGYKKITDVKPVTQVTPPTTQPVSFADKAPVSALFNPVTSPIPSKTVTKTTTGVFPTLQTKLAEKPYVSPYPTEHPATISPAGETILKTVAKTGVSLLDQVTKGLDFTQDLIAKNLVHKDKPSLLGQVPGVINLNDRWLNWYTQKESKGELLTQKAQKFVDTLAKSDYVQNRPEWESLPLREKLNKKNLGETILNLVPSVLSSVALYAINPAVGFVAAASSTAQEVKEDAIKNGVEEKKAEKLALATGLTVGALDKIVPDEIFRSKEVKKIFLKEFMKNLVRRTVTEAGTEIAQEDIQMIAEQTYKEISKDEKKTRQVMSALGGALGGTGFSVIGDFANMTVQNEIMQTPPTKKSTVEEIKFSNPQTLADEIGNSEPGGVKSVDKLSKTLETKDDEIYRDRVEEYKQKIQAGEAIDPIVITPKGEVLDGGHRLTAMKELGIKATETVIQKEKPTTKGLTPEVKPKVVEKEVSVPREQIPIGEGKQKVSRLESRVNKISKKISEIPQETIDRLSLATYNQLNKKENISKAVKYARKNPDEALKVLTGEIEAPKGILRNAIYVAMQNEAIGDVELARKIASIGATRLGQEISILTEIDPNSPVKLMSDVIKIKEEAYNKRFGKQKKTDVTERSVNELKKSVKKPDKYDWNSFINSIQC